MADLIENRLRVVDSKTETGERSIAIPPIAGGASLAAPAEHCVFGRTDRVFCNPDSGAESS